MKEPAMAPQGRRDAAAISDGGGDKPPTRSDTSRLGDTSEATTRRGTALSHLWDGRTYLHLSRGNGPTGLARGRITKQPPNLWIFSV